MIEVARVLLASYFVGSGIRHFFVFDAVAGAMEQRGLPFPRALLAAGTAFELAAGTLLALGLWVAPAALGLIAFTLASSVMLLDWWNKQGPERDAAVSGFLANLAVCGGLLLAVAAA